MAAGIFVERDGVLVPMVSRPYSSEDLLQGLLERHSALLAGDQLTPDLEARRFILVRREAGVPDSAGAADRWALDHLFLDQDGVPTLVEVKRSSDTRIRREVVGQMLDYAANAVVYWPVTRLVNDVDQTHSNASGGATGALCELLDIIDGTPAEVEASINAYWQQVASNLAAGRVRLLFVADVIPTELRRVIEFLNQQMSPAEVLGVEIVNYEGEGLRALVPRIVGLTEAAREHKATSSQPSMSEIWAAAPSSTLQARDLLDRWATEHHLQQWDSGKSRRYGPNSSRRPPVFLYPTYDQVFLMLNAVPVDEAERARTTLVELLGHPVASKEPGINCTELVDRWSDFEQRLLTPLSEAAASAAE